jgi:hypothetical protein
LPAARDRESPLQNYGFAIGVDALIKAISVRLDNKKAIPSAL